MSFEHMEKNLHVMMYFSKQNEVMSLWPAQCANHLLKHMYLV